MASTFKSSVQNTVGTTPVTVYTTPASTQSTVIGLTVANVTTNQILVNATITKGATTTHVIKNAPVPAGSSLVLFGGDQKLVLEASNSFAVASNTAASADCIISVLELT